MDALGQLWGRMSRRWAIPPELPQLYVWRDVDKHGRQRDLCKVQVSGFVRWAALFRFLATSGQKYH